MATNFELKILTDLSAMPKVVETNIDEVQPVIDAAIAKLKGLEVTDNKADIVAADEDTAKLRKMRDAIKRFRIDHMALWKEPLADFERKCKECEAKLDNAATEIANKTNEVKDLWRSRKREKCAKLWQDKLDEAFDNAEIKAAPHFKAFFDYWCEPKTKGTWVNSSVSMATVESAMVAEIERVKGVIEATMANYANENEEVKAKAVLALRERFDIADVIKVVNDWKREQAEIAARAERERQLKAEREEALKAAAAAKEAAKEVAAPQGGQGAPVPIAKPTPNDNGVSDKIETYRLEIKGTRSALIELRQFGLAHGITFTKID